MINKLHGKEWPSHICKHFQLKFGITLTIEDFLKRYNVAGTMDGAMYKLYMEHLTFLAREERIDEYLIFLSKKKFPISIHAYVKIKREGMGSEACIPLEVLRTFRWDPKHEDKIQFLARRGGQGVCRQCSHLT